MINIESHIKDCKICLKGDYCLAVAEELERLIKVNSEDLLAFVGNLKASLYSHGSSSDTPYSLKITHNGSTIYLTQEEAEGLASGINKWLHGED
jgi:hypothetical protein